MKKDNCIIVCAFSIYPEIASSEGIVNKNWIDILNGNKLDCLALSSDGIISINKKNSQLKSAKSNTLRLLYKWSTMPNNSFLGVLYRIANKVCLKILRLPKASSFYQVMWVKIQKRNIFKIIKNKEITVFWARILPAFSILPIIKIWNTKRIPLVVNVNDPFLNEEDSISYEEKIFLETADKAQCWTFPCVKLAEFIAIKYKLDRNRCFVIPHAMRKQEKIYSPFKIIPDKLKFLYTGTFYKSAFLDSFGLELIKFSGCEEFKSVEFTFILSQYDDFSLQWINMNVPNATIYTKLSREKVLEITAEADCMLVVDSVNHQNLLKGKLIESISQGLPIFAITYKNSVMDNVVKEYGGLSSYQNIENDISEQLKNMVNNLKDQNWRSYFCKKREVVMDKISENKITSATIDISNYAKNRFLWQEGKIKSEPLAPQNYNWP